MKVWIHWFRNQASSATQQSSSAFKMPHFSQTPLSSVIIDINSYFGKICNYKLDPSVVGITTYYPEIEFQGGGEIFRTRPYWPWVPPNLGSLQFVPGPFPGVKWHGLALTIHPNRAPRLEKEYRRNVHHLCVFTACSRVNLTLPVPFAGEKM